MSKDKGTKNIKKAKNDKKVKVLSEYQASKKTSQITFIDPKDSKK